MSSVTSAHLFSVLQNINQGVDHEYLTDLGDHVCTEIHLAWEYLKLLLKADRLHAWIVVRAACFVTDHTFPRISFTHLKCASSFG
jgi:hypothetical protein